MKRAFKEITGNGSVSDHCEEAFIPQNILVTGTLPVLSGPRLLRGLEIILEYSVRVY